MTKRLEGRTAVITGGGSGIGYATVARLADEGATVVVVDTNTASGQRVADEVSGLFIQADVTDAAQVENMYKVAFDTYGRIDIASFVASMGSATSQISYTASKGGVLAMSRELGVQFAREGIRVNALSPGPVNTPLLQELFAKDPERAARRLVHVPMGRFAQASEIAAAVAFLASDDSSFITASNFLVDGGISGAYVTPLHN